MFVLVFRNFLTVVPVYHSFIIEKSSFFSVTSLHLHPVFLSSLCWLSKILCHTWAMEWRLIMLLSSFSLKLTCVSSKHPCHLSEHCLCHYHPLFYFVSHVAFAVNLLVRFLFHFLLISLVDRWHLKPIRKVPRGTNADTRQNSAGRGPQNWAEPQMLPTSREFCGIWYWRVISDTMGRMTNDTISDALIVNLTVIEIVNVFIDFAWFNNYCLLIDRFKNYQA